VSDPNFWSKDIRELRLEKGLSQRELAKLAKVNRTTLRSIEEGKGPIQIDIYERLLAALGYELMPIKREVSLEELRRQASIETDPKRRSQLAMQILLRLAPGTPET
jgi:transcriptional regulator with XRE-family HTH domain